MPKPLPTQAELLALLSYDPDTGILYWRRRPEAAFPTNSEMAARLWNGKFAGKPALNCIGAHGYRCGNLSGRVVYAHRVIWMMMAGDRPSEIDHIDGNSANNRWGNLRNVSRSGNARNLPRRCGACAGVALFGSFYRAEMRVAGVHLHLGSFSSEAEACETRQIAEAVFGFHENHGRAKSLVA